MGVLGNMESNTVSARLVLCRAGMSPAEIEVTANRGDAWLSPRRPRQVCSSSSVYRLPATGSLAAWWWYPGRAAVLP